MKPKAFRSEGEEGEQLGSCPGPPPAPILAALQLSSERCSHEDASALGTQMAAIFIHSYRINLDVAL